MKDHRKPPAHPDKAEPSRGADASPPARDTAGRRRLTLQLQQQIGNRRTGAVLGLGEGKPLEPGARSATEHAYGADFTDVRIHTDGPANALAGSHDARAVSFGRTIAFGSGEYSPGSLDTDMVLAHELAHVAQQSPETATSPAAESLEADADQSAAAGVAALRGNAQLAGSAAPALRSTLQFRRCGRRAPAPPTAALSVAGATRFAADNYVTITGAPAVIAVTGVSTPPGTPIPANTVTWTGGTAGADQFHRLVPTGAAGVTTVTATGGGRTLTATVHVVAATAPPAMNPPATLRHILLAAPAVPTPPALGLTVVTIGSQGVTGPEFDVTAHLDGTNWRFRVSEIRHSYKVGINGGGLTPISGPGDPAITPDTIGPIITAFTPRSATTPPPTTPYWSPSIVRAHEEAHVNRFYTGFWEPRMRTLESEIEAATVAFDPATAATAVAAVAGQRAAWQARANALHQAADAAEIPASETFAHSASNALWLALISSIRDTVVPPAPTALTGVAGSGGVTLNWTPRNVVNTNGFVIQRRRGTGPFVDVATVGAADRTHTDSPVPAGSVTYRVLAVGAAGRSAASPVQTITIRP